MRALARVRPITPGAHLRPYLALAVGLLAVSTAAIFIRLAQDEGAPSLVVAAVRLSVAALVLTPVVLRGHRAELRAVPRGELGWMLLSGGVLGLHFATWITSLEYTAVVNSVTLVTTAPLWVALLAPIMLHERLDRATVFGLGLAVGGGLLVGLSGASGDPPTRQDPALGNSLALVGAWAAALYFVIGRRVRARLGVMVYIWLVYSVAAVVLIGAALAAGQRLGGLPATAYLWMLLLGLVPQLVGHSSFNYALGYLPAVYVGLIVLGEPIGSGILAMIFLDEWPVLLQLAGSALILVGIGVASRRERAGAAET